MSKKITFVTAESIPFRSTAAYVQDERALTAAEREAIEETSRSAVTESRNFFPGASDELQLFEVRVPPNAVVQPHAHHEDEIMYVLAGELRFGSTVLTAGGSVCVKGNTLYGFSAGPDGARFLNFRGRRDFSYVSKADFLAERRDAGPR